MFFLVGPRARGQRFAMTAAAPARAALSDPVKATLWVMGATVSFITMAVSGREAGQALTTAELLVWRSVIGLGVTVGLMLIVSGGVSEIRTRRFGSASGAQPVSLLRPVRLVCGGGADPAGPGVRA
jgi:hypothetical protein